LQEAMLSQSASMAELIEVGRSFRVLAGSLLSFACLVWYVVWTYRAYALSANLKGWRAAVSYVVCIVAADAASRYLLALL